MNKEFLKNRVLTLDNFIRLFSVLSLIFVFIPCYAVGKENAGVFVKEKSLSIFSLSTGFNLAGGDAFKSSYLFLLVPILLLIALLSTFIFTMNNFRRCIISSITSFAAICFSFAQAICLNKYVSSVSPSYSVDILPVFTIELILFYVVTLLSVGVLLELEGRKNKAVNVKIGDAAFSGINITFFTLFTLMCVFPFYYLFINTISDNTLVATGQVNFYPRGLHFQNYINIFKVGDLTDSMLVTVARTVLGTATMVVASAFVGYLVTKQEMWGRKIFYRLLVITMYFNAGLIPWYLNMSMLGLTNSFWAYIIPGIVAPYNIILVKTYIESIPAELEESASIDGAGYMKIFANIIWPLSKPILATIAIFGAVGNWNSFTDSMILMQNAPKLFSLQYRLYIYLNSTNNVAQMMNQPGAQISDAIASTLSTRTVNITISMFSMIPIMLVYPFMQRYFTKGIMLGAVKG
ncbi:MAG: carbohydrate ABC transporter permease [Lachnospiraceae bacterium]|nr:carbohydrate ABC transporter permease [Lachnospiraceae bacterium]